jgi:P pilus assembly chaperone PapD
MRIKILSCCALFSFAARANLQVYPTRLTLDDKARVSQLTLTHTGKDTTTYEIVPVFYEQDAKGRMKGVEGAPAKSALRSAAELLRYSPRVFTLKTGQTQTLKVRAQPKPGLDDGIYRIHLRIQPAPDAVKATAPVKAPAEGEKKGAANLQLTALLAVAVPVYFSHGKIERTVDISEIELSPDGKKVGFTLKQSGNGFVFGDLRVSLQPPEGVKGEAQELARMLSMASYAPERRIDLELDSALARKKLGAQRLLIEVRQSPDEGDAVLGSGQAAVSAL